MQDLSDEVVDFLNGVEGFEFTNKFVEKFGLVAKQKVKVVNLVLDTVLGQIALADLPKEIESRLELSADQAKEAAVELAGHRLLPIAGAVGNVAAQIQEWGGDLSNFQDQNKVAVPELTAESFVQGVLKDLGVELGDHVMQHRLELILVSYAKGVRDQNEAVGTLTRAQKVGGLDMEQADAEALLEAIDEKLSFINISFKEEGAKDSKDAKVSKVKKVMDVKPPKKKVGNSGAQVGKKKSKKMKRDPKVDQMLKTLEEDKKKSEEMLAEMKKVKPSKKKVKKDPEVDQMMKTLEEDRKKSKQMIEEMKKVGNGGTQVGNGETGVGNGGTQVGKKDTAGAAKKDLKVEVEAKNRNHGAPAGALQAGLSRKSEKRNSKSETKDKSGKKKFDTSILKKKAESEIGKDVFSHEDEEEIKRIASVKAKALAGSADPAQALIERIIGAAKLEFKDPEIKKRFVKAVDSRIRDVRDIYEVRAQLENPKDKGGVGLTGAKLAETVQAIDRLVNEHQAKLQAKVEQKKQESVKQKKAQAVQAQAQAKARQEQLMAKRYAELTGQAPDEAAVGPVTRTSAAMSAEETMARQEQQIDAQKVKQAVVGSSRQAQKKAQMSAASIPAGEKPQVQDVRFTRRLAGPIEELRNMGLVEFRRLSTDPEEAIEKIKDRITLVEDQGYDQRIAAIKAWRSSPINQEYLALSRQALLSGQKIEDILKENGAGGLTQAELSAIMKLNSEIHL